MRRVLIVGLMIGSLASFAATPGDSVRVKTFRHFFTIGSGMVFCTACDFGNKAVAAPWFTDGLEFKERHRLGAGVSYHSLGTANALPYFASISTDLFGKKNKVFFEFNYGGALMRSTLKNVYGLQSVYSPVYIRSSLGYAWKYERTRFNLHLGYQYMKTITRYQYGSGYYYGNSTYVPPSFDEVTWSASRFFFGISVGV